jgi:hypothetical protein
MADFKYPSPSSSDDDDDDPTLWEQRTGLFYFLEDSLIGATSLVPTAPSPPDPGIERKSLTPPLLPTQSYQWSYTHDADMRMLSTDIECAGRERHFPRLERDPVTMICMSRQSQSTPLATIFPRSSWSAHVFRDDNKRLTDQHGKKRKFITTPGCASQRQIAQRIKEEAIDKLRKELGPRFRSVDCRNYKANRGYCPDGDLCTFRHDPCVLGIQRPLTLQIF